MKIGDLVAPKEGRGILDFDYGVGLIIGEAAHSKGLMNRVAYIVQWHHEHQWWDDDELIPVVETRTV